MQLYTKILIGLIAGGTIGAIANAANLTGLAQFLIALEPIGTGFIRLITMIVIPLVVASLLVGTASLGDISKLGRIGGKTLGYYMFTTAIAVTIGLGLSNLVKPGSDIDPATRDQLAERFQSEAQGKMEIAAEAPSLVDVLLNMIPRKPHPGGSGLRFAGLDLLFARIRSGGQRAARSPKDPRALLLRRRQQRFDGHHRLGDEDRPLCRLCSDRLRGRSVRPRLAAQLVHLFARGCFGAPHPLVRHGRDTGAAFPRA